MYEEKDIPKELLSSCLPYMAGFMAMELLVGFVLKKRLYRLSDAINKYAIIKTFHHRMRN